MSSATIARSAPRKAGRRAGVYVYAVVWADSLEGQRAVGSPGMGSRGNRVRTIRSGDLAALVSDSPKMRYDVSRDNLLTHQRVLEELIGFTEVLPARFGLISSSDERIAKILLKDRHDELVTILEHIRGRVELGLKVFWKRDKLFSDIAEGRDDIRSLREDTTSRSKAAAHFDEIRLGQLVEGAMEQLRGGDADEILGELEPLSSEVKTNDLLTDMMILNAAFLVEKAQEKAFDAAVSAIAGRNAERLMVKYVGPLPAYNFVDITWEGL